MRAKRKGEPFDQLKSERINLTLERIVIENTPKMEICLEKDRGTKEYWVGIYYSTNNKRLEPIRIYSEHLKDKRDARKRYNIVLETLKDGNYTLKLNLNEAYFAIHLFAEMLRESLDNYKGKK